MGRTTKAREMDIATGRMGYREINVEGKVPAGYAGTGDKSVDVSEKEKAQRAEIADAVYPKLDGWKLWDYIEQTGEMRWRYEAERRRETGGVRQEPISQRALKVEMESTPVLYVWNPNKRPIRTNFPESQQYDAAVRDACIRIKVDRKTDHDIIIFKAEQGVGFSLFAEGKLDRRMLDVAGLKWVKYDPKNEEHRKAPTRYEDIIDFTKPYEFISDPDTGEPEVASFGDNVDLDNVNITKSKGGVDVVTKKKAGKRK